MKLTEARNTKIYRREHERLRRSQERFVAKIKDRYSWGCWAAYLTSQPGPVLGVLGWGALSMMATVAIPAIFTHFSDSLHSGQASVTAALLLGLMVALKAGTWWFREQSDYRLVRGVRQLALNSFFTLGLEEPPSGVRKQAGRFSTHPQQISNISNVVDLVPRVAESILMAVFVVVTFGSVGVFALVAITISIAVTIYLVHRIGIVYHLYIGSEADRMDLLREVSDHADQIRRSRFDRYVPDWLQEHREKQQPILRRRSKLQLFNSLVTTASVPAIIAAGGVYALLSPGPNLPNLVALLVAANLLSSSMHDAVVNYRVSRLAVPMLREWDDLRRQAAGRKADVSVLETVPGRLTALQADTDDQQLRDLLTQASHQGEISLVPSDFGIPADIVGEWYGALDEGRRAAAHRLAADFHLPADLWQAGRADTLSRGEKARLTLLIALASSEAPCVVSAEALGALDRKNRGRIVDRALKTHRLLILGSAPAGLPEHPVMRAHAQGQTLLLETVAAINGDGVAHSETVPFASDAEQSAGEGAANGNEADGEADAPDKDAAADAPSISSPRPNLASVARVAVTIYGLWLTVIVALLTISLALITTALPALLNLANSTADRSGLALIMALLFLAVVIVVSLLSTLQFRATIPKMTRFHRAVAEHIPRISGPARTGDLIGRYGDDFFDMQMYIPGQLTAVLTVVLSMVILITGVAIGNPWILLIAAVLLPVSLLVYRRGERRLVTAATRLARARGRMYKTAAAALECVAARTSTGLIEAAQKSYGRSMDIFVEHSIDSMRARQRQRIELDSLSVSILVLGLLSTLGMVGSGLNLIAPTVLTYFVYRIAVELPDLLESTQGISVALATGERVLVLQDTSEYPDKKDPINAEALEQLKGLLREHTPGCQGRLIRVSGESGAGKSTTLRNLCRQVPDALVVEDDIPVQLINAARFKDALGLGESDLGKDTKDTESSGTIALGELSQAERQRLLIDYAASCQASLVVLDETMSSLSPDEQQQETERLYELAHQQQRTLIVVSHTAKDSGRYDHSLHIK